MPNGFLFGLASGGVYLAMNCYQPCGALLPHPFTLTFDSNCLETYWRRSSLCCTCRRFTPPRRYLAPCPMKPGLSSPASITEISTAAIVWLTSSGILTNFAINCLRFFEQLVVYIYPWAHHCFLHDWDHAEYNPLDKIIDTAVYHDVQHIRYIGQGESHRSPHP